MNQDEQNKQTSIKLYGMIISGNDDEVIGYTTHSLIFKENP